MSKISENQKFHPFIQVIVDLSIGGMQSDKDKNKTEKLWKKIQDYCLLICGDSRKTQTGRNDSEQSCDFLPESSKRKVSDLINDKKKYNRVIEDIYMSSWNEEFVFQAIISEFLPKNSSGYLIAKILRIPRTVRTTAEDSYITQGKCNTTGNNMIFQTVMTWSLVANDTVLPIRYRLVDTGLFDADEINKLRELIEEREMIVYAPSELGKNISFLHHLETPNKLNYIVEVPCDFEVTLSEDFKGSLKNTGAQESVYKLAKRKFANDAKFINPMRKDFKKVSWEDKNGSHSSYFLLQKVRILTKKKGEELSLGDEKLLLIEWPLKEDAPSKYWLTNITIGSKNNETTVRSITGYIRRCSKAGNVFEKLIRYYFLFGYHAKNPIAFHHHAALCFIAYILCINSD